MDLLAGAAFAECGVYACLAVYFALFSLRPAPERREYGLFALACSAVAIYAACTAQHFRVRDDVKAAAWIVRTVIPGLVVAAASLHVTLSYAELERRLRLPLVAATWGIALVLGVAHAAGAFFTGVLRTREVSLGPLTHTSRWFEPRPTVFALHGFFVLCAALVVAMLVKALRDGKREAWFALVGASVMALAVVNDVLVADGVIQGVTGSEHAFAVFAFGLSYTLLARHARFAEVLDAKGGELRKRAQKLRRAYEELRAAQEELVRREQLAVIGELAAVVSHEVRNPLAIIRNAVAGLRRPTVNAEDRETLLGILDEETSHLNHLVGDLLRYARPIHVERQRLDLDGLVAKACELARQNPLVRLEREGSAAELEEAHGDANLLRQVLDNLVQNACQAMPEGGTLTVRLLAAREDGLQGVAVEVADTGEGMDTIVRSRARTPFFTTRTGGTGLGLAICDRIVKAHGGVLAIKSRAMEGTIVRVFLPSGPPPAEPTRSSVPPPSTQPLADREALAYEGTRR